MPPPLGTAVSTITCLAATTLGPVVAIATLPGAGDGHATNTLRVGAGNTVNSNGVFAFRFARACGVWRCGAAQT